MSERNVALRRHQARSVWLSTFQLLRANAHSNVHTEQLNTANDYFNFAESREKRSRGKHKRKTPRK